MSLLTAARPPAAGYRDLIRLPLFWGAVAACGAVAFYWNGVVSLLEAWEQDEYSHGYIIPLIALYLFLSRVRAADPARRFVGWPGVAGAVFGLLVGLLGNLSGIPDLVAYGLIIYAGGLAVAGLGLRRAAPALLAIVYLLFMLPLPNFIYWPLSIQLQLVSSQIGVAVIRLFDIPVYLDGNVIDLGVYQLQVAEACSGLRYLFPLMSFGFLFAVLYKGPAWHKLIIFLATIPITVLMNSLRIGTIGVLVDRYGIEQAEGFLHTFEGWIIFLACIVILYGLAALLQRLCAKPIPVHQMIDLDVRSALSRLGGLAKGDAPRTLIAATLLLVLGAAAWQLSPARALVFPERLPFALFATDLGPWSGEHETLEPDIERVLGADDYLLATYTGPAEGPPINLLIAYYDSQTQGSGIHSPEVCLPTGGWEVSAWQRHATAVRDGSGEPLVVNRAVIQKGLDRQVVYYWFEQRGRSLTSDYAAKAVTVLDSIVSGRTDGALVRLITPIDATEGESAADRRLEKYLGLMLPELPEFVPG